MKKYSLSNEIRIFFFVDKTLSKTKNNPNRNNYQIKFRSQLIVLWFTPCFVITTVLSLYPLSGNWYHDYIIVILGLGVLLVVVVAVGWKCTPRGHEPLHALFGLGDFRHQERRSRSQRHGRSSRAREQQWYGGKKRKNLECMNWSTCTCTNTINVLGNRQLLSLQALDFKLIFRFKFLYSNYSYNSMRNRGIYG